MKKIMALLLSMILAVAMISTAVFAEEPAEAPEDAAVEAADEAALEDTGDSEGASEGIELMTAPEVNLSQEGEVIIEDYSTIEVPASAVTISDFMIESYINSILDYAMQTEYVSEGTAEEGDTVNLDFSGVLEGETEPFDGGTAEGYEIVLGSGTFIPGFEDQIIGHEIGETFDINVTFPEEYAEEMAGKNAVFTITLNNKVVKTTPELTDEFVQEFSSTNLPEQLNSVEELRTYTQNYLYKNNLQNAMMTALQDKTTVVSYKQDQFDLMKAYSRESLDYYAAMYASYGMENFETDAVAQMYGYENAEAYTASEAKYYLDMIMMIDKLAADLGIEVTDEEVDAAIAEYMASYGYDADYTVEDFKELSGEAWVLLLTALDVKYVKVMEALEPNAVVVEDEAADPSAAPVEEAGEGPDAAEQPEEEAEAPTEEAAEGGVMSYADYAAAAIDDEVTVALYVQATQSWWDGTITVYGADEDGAYFVYNMACSEEDAAKLVPGTKIVVNGYKAEWSGEVEIADATFTFAEDGTDGYIAAAADVTEILGSEELADHMNQFVAFNGLTVEASADADGNEAPFLYNWDGSGTQGDDLYFNASINGQTFTFTVESYLCGADTDVYKAVEGLNVGDVIDMEGFLYWYNGANPHITSVTVK